MSDTKDNLCLSQTLMPRILPGMLLIMPLLQQLHP